jgi:hypothetical protein
VVERAGFENRWAARLRGFESLPLRHCPARTYDDAASSGAFRERGLAPPIPSLLPWLGYASDLAALWDDHWERWQERAAILEYDGGLHREEAERRAWQELAP